MLECFRLFTSTIFQSCRNSFLSSWVARVLSSNTVTPPVECFVFDKLPDAPENACRLHREYIHRQISNIFTRHMVTLTVNVPQMVVKVSAESLVITKEGK